MLLAYRALQLSFVALVAVVSSAAAQEGPVSRTELQAENERLRTRMSRMESEMSELRALVSSIQSEPRYVAARHTELEEVVNEVITDLQAEAPPVRGRWPVKLYGFVRFDLSWDSALGTPGNTIAWALQDGTNGSDDQVHLTARQTRLGFEFQGPTSGSMNTRALIETDFWGDAGATDRGGGRELNGLLRMRRAFLELQWKEHDLVFLAGQEWEMVGPVIAPTLKDANLYWSGDVGQFKPQLRLTKGFKIAEQSKIEVAVALARGIGLAPAAGAINSQAIVDTGADAGWPNVHARVGFHGILWVPEKTARFGLFGHVGEYEVDLLPNGDGLDAETWSAGFYLDLPLTEWMALRGELWVGESMGAFQGGIGQTYRVVNAGTGVQEIGAIGGWAALLFGPFDGFRFNLGGGVDDPFGGDLAANARNRNMIVYANALYDVNEAATVALELMYVRTGYVAAKDEDLFRVQIAFVYRF